MDGVNTKNAEKVAKAIGLNILGLSDKCHSLLMHEITLRFIQRYFARIGKQTAGLSHTSAEKNNADYFKQLADNVRDEARARVKLSLECQKDEKLAEIHCTFHEL